MTNVGLFGGTFDPVHQGHMQCATAALVEAGIDNIVFVPSARPPHKKGEYICNFDHRLAMLKIAVTLFENFSISDLERKRSHPSYTIDTLKIIQDRADRSTKYHFIIGCDAFLEIESWYRWQAVIAQIDFLIVVRPGYNKSKLNELLNRNNFNMDSGHMKTWYNQEGENSIRLLTTETEDISSTEIRRRIREKRPWKHFVADDVGFYIVKHSLYL